jgi:hypothetical protein
MAVAPASTTRRSTASASPAVVTTLASRTPDAGRIHRSSTGSGGGSSWPVARRPCSAGGAVRRPRAPLPTAQASPPPARSSATTTAAATAARPRLGGRRRLREAPLEPGQHGVGRGAPAGVLVEEREHERVQPGRDARDPGGRRRGHPAQGLPHELVRGPGERRPAGEELERQHAQRVQIGGRRQRLLLQVLGRHHREVAHAPLAVGEAAGVVLGRDQPGQAEIPDPRAALVVHEHVGGGEIAVHHALAVQRPDAHHQHRQQLRRVAPRGGAGADPVGERALGHRREHRVRARVVHARVQELQDARRADAPERLDLALAPTEPLVVGEVIGAHPLEAHGPVAPPVARPPHAAEELVRQRLLERVPAVDEVPDRQLTHGSRPPGREHATRGAARQPRSG